MKKKLLKRIGFTVVGVIAFCVACVSTVEATYLEMNKYYYRNAAYSSPNYIATTDMRFEVRTDQTLTYGSWYDWSSFEVVFMVAHATSTPIGNNRWSSSETGTEVQLFGQVMFDVGYDGVDWSAIPTFSGIDRFNLTNVWAVITQRYTDDQGDDWANVLYFSDQRVKVQIYNQSESMINIRYDEKYDDYGQFVNPPVFSDEDFIHPVPEPATMLLFGSGLVGLAGFRRRFRKN